MGWKSPGSTRERMYGNSQTRIFRYTCDIVQSRFSGIVPGPGSDNFSGYCGNTGSESDMPFDTSTGTGPGAECISKLWISTSMRNFGALAMLLFLHAADK